MRRSSAPDDFKRLAGKADVAIGGRPCGWLGIEDPLSQRKRRYWKDTVEEDSVKWKGVGREEVSAARHRTGQGVTLFFAACEEATVHLSR